MADIALFRATTARDVSHLQQLDAILAIDRRARDADTHADHDLVPLDIEGSVERPDHPLAQCPYFIKSVYVALQHGKLVTAYARNQVPLPHASSQARPNLLQQLVTARMPQGVIDILSRGRD